MLSFAPFDPMIVWSIAFWMFLLVDTVLLITLLRSAIDDLKGRGYLEVDGEKTCFINRKTANKYTFTDITEVCDDLSVYPVRDTLYICFGKREYCPVSADMRHSDRLFMKLSMV